MNRLAISIALSVGVPILVWFGIKGLRQTKQPASPVQNVTTAIQPPVQPSPLPPQAPQPPPQAPQPPKPIFVPAAQVATRLLYEPTTVTVIDNFPERVRGRRVALLNAQFLELDGYYIDELPGITLESNGLQSFLNLREKEKWVGFGVRDADGVGYSRVFARKDSHGDQLLALGKRAKIHCFGQMIQLHRAGGKLGFIVEVLFPADPEGIPAAKVEELAGRLISPGISPRPTASNKTRTWDDLSLTEKERIVGAVNLLNRDIEVWNAVFFAAERISMLPQFDAHRVRLQALGIRLIPIDESSIRSTLPYVSDVKGAWRDP